MANGGIIGPVNNPTASVATGVWEQEEQYQAQVGGIWPPIPAIGLNSCRFDDGSSDSLSRTKGTSSSTTKGTYSFWFKLSKITGLTLIENGTAAADRAIVYIQSDSTLKLFSKIGNSTKLDLGTNRVFRDVSAWYNVVIAIDTTQGTDTNRVKLYVNGVQETSFASSTYPAQNDALRFFTSNEIEEIGIDFENGGLFDGYMAEVIKIDGQQLAPTSFGESDANGFWKPIPLNISAYGTNGFRLKYENAADLGEDSSPNGNNFTVNNLTSIDQATDTPTNNFATLNPLNYTSTAIPYSEGNTYGTFPGAWMASLPTIGLTNGKWFWEAKLNSGNDNNMFYGVAREGIDLDSTPYTQTGVIVQKNNGARYVDGSYTAGAAESIASGNTLGVALDLDSGTKTIKFYKNGTLLSSGSSINLTSNFDGYTLFPIFIGNSSSGTAEWQTNFGNPAYAISSGNADGNGYGNFEYAVPSGYLALNTANLSEVLS